MFSFASHDASGQPISYGDGPPAVAYLDDRRGRPVERVAIVSPDKIPTGRFWFLPYYDPKNTINDTMRAAFKTMFRHPVIKAGLLKKTLAVAAQPWQLQLENKDNPKEQEFGDFIRHAIERLPEGMPGLIQAVTLPRLIDGYQAAEKVRTVEFDEPRWRGKVLYDDIRQKPTEMYEPIVDAYARVTGIRGRLANEGEEWPLKDFFWTRHLPIYDNPLGTSDLAAAYSAFWMADTVTKLRAIHAEKRAAPILKGECDTKDTIALGDALQLARSQSWLVVPTGAKVDALNMSQQSEDIYKSFIDDCDKKMLIGINGAYLQMLEGQIADGRGSASVSMSVSELFEWLLGAVFCHAAKKQLFRELRDMNYVGVPVPSLTLGGVNEADITAILANFKAAQDLGFDLSRSEVAERTSLQVAKDDQDKLTARLVTGGFGSPFGAPTPGVPADPAKQEVDLLNTVGGATSLTTMQTSYYAGDLPREAAIQAAVTVYGMSRPEAEKLFPPQAPKPTQEPTPAQRFQAFADIPRDEVALAGPDGKQAAKLLGKAKDTGSLTLYYLTRRAVTRLLADPNPMAATHLFDDSEYVALTNSLAATNATANLLGRARVRERAQQGEYRKAGVMQYSDSDCFAQFADAPPPLPPQQAIDYFQSLVPSLAVKPETFGPMLRRQAFTLAARTDETMLDQVKKVIGESLQTGKTSGAVPNIQTILERAGVAPESPQYAELVFRVNMMDSFNQGAMAELQSPDMKEFFPAWEYLAIPDNRARPTHADRNGKLYPNTAAFGEVRGTDIGDIANCRCSFRPIDKMELSDMESSGRSVETDW